MSPELEAAMLGALFGALLLPVLYVATGWALGYLRRRHGVAAEEVLSAED